MEGSQSRGRVPGWKRFEGADEWLRKRDTMAQGEREQFNQFLAGRREKAAVASVRGARPAVPGILGMARRASAAEHARQVTSRGQSNENAVTDGREVVVMSAPVRNGEGTPSTFPTMYAPPWARGAAVVPVMPVMPVLPPSTRRSTRARNSAAPCRRRRSLEDGKRWRDKPFEGDLAAKRLRERPTLDPVAMPMPPMRDARRLCCAARACCRRHRPCGACGVRRGRRDAAIAAVGDGGAGPAASPRAAGRHHPATGRDRARVHFRRAGGARGALRRRTGEGGDRAGDRAARHPGAAARRPSCARSIARKSRCWSSAARI